MVSKEESLKIAKDKLNYINEEIKELGNILDKIGYEYKLFLETIDVSTIENKKSYSRLSVFLDLTEEKCDD